MQIANLIDLPNATVTSVTRNDLGHLFITVETTESSIACRVCGKQLTKCHGCDKERTLRHLPVFDNPTYIIYKPNRHNNLFFKRNSDCPTLVCGHSRDMRFSFLHNHLAQLSRNTKSGRPKNFLKSPILLPPFLCALALRQKFTSHLRKLTTNIQRKSMCRHQ